MVEDTGCNLYLGRRGKRGSLARDLEKRFVSILILRCKWETDLKLVYRQFYTPFL